jgi:hypothetical protein
MLNYRSLKEALAKVPAIGVHVHNQEFGMHALTAYVQKA